jgi:hypothetical protein
VGTLVPAALLALARAATAEEGGTTPSPIRFSLSYQAPEGCPTAAEFQRGVESRATSAEPADEGDAAVRLQVTLAREEARTTGVLVVTLPDGTSSERRVGDASCEAAASSLAVMSALVLDAHLRGPEPPAGETPASAPPASAGASPEPPAPAPAERPVAATPRPASRDAEGGLRVRVRAHAAWESSVAPGVPLGALAGGELSWSGAGPLSPAVGANGLAAFGRATTPAGDASFRLLAVRLFGCPLRLGLPGDAALRLCAEADAGALRGEGDAEVRNHTARTMPWLAAGLALHGELPIAAGLALEASAGARALARGDRFLFRPGEPVHDVPRWSAGASLGLSYGF